MDSPMEKRSQVILRMPVDYRDATLTLDDGEKFDAILFVPPGESVERHLLGPEAFLPLMRAARIVFVARAAIVCATTAAPPASEPELPMERQRVSVKLRGGTTLEGALCWPAVEGRQRTADHLNAPDAFLVLATTEHVHYLAKSHVLVVKELDS